MTRLQAIDLCIRGMLTIGGLLIISEYIGRWTEEAIGKFNRWRNGRKGLAVWRMVGK
jgi:hypothetical protein